eukprot:TRINITY_DN1222_c0_g1_i1.p1 TRINITY_DN1222_c0_g1~~TRINITY_DN1222_c0_g1_i1.p1  ORF type:complete len:603 (-),score=99.91 TRINITY_DN1222_c0_g1_i1:100-1908(-)
MTKLVRVTLLLACLPSVLGGTCHADFRDCQDYCTTRTAHFQRQCVLGCARTSAHCSNPEVQPMLPTTSALNKWPSFNDALGQPTLPFGFYQYTVTAPYDVDSPGFEARYGMSLASPYTSSAAPTDAWWTQTQAFLDRAAVAGFKVNFQLIAFETLPNDDATLANLTAQIKRFKSHPAVLAWYLADEPDGQGIPAASLKPKYDAIKAADSYHPVAMVFNTAGASAYLPVVDLIMVDPYPIPGSSAGSMAAALTNVATLGRPVMLVPQAFGGGENWARGPSAQEERVMTYIGLMHGVVAIQYFVRERGVFPMPNAWSEIRKLAAEVKELTPSLLSGVAVPVVVQNSSGGLKCDVHAAGFRDRDGSVVVLVASHNNADGQPCGFRVALDANASWGPAEKYAVRIMFENRNLESSGIGSNGTFSDALRGFGTAAYRLEPVAGAQEPGASLVYNGGYELCANPAMPDGNYVGAAADGAAYYMAEFRDSIKGRTSLHLHLPSAGSAFALSPYTVPTLTADAPYSFSVWLRGALGGEQICFEFTPAILNGTSGSVECVNATTSWHQVTVSLTAGHDMGTACKYGCRSWLSYGLKSAGDVWIDELSLVAA